ncbi:MAG TPA: UvrD-helicase domain-containing protein [bacterium]|nr:UvrD-helicase domain-containing protein [bacterium]
MQDPTENNSPIEHILEDLNEQQRQAVVHGDGPLLVLAGAGSGKTRVITYRIAYLIVARGIAPWQILAVTFTNKAAGEMRERTRLLIPDQAEGVWISTFHSFCARLLRRHADQIHLDEGFSIFDRTDQTTVIRRAMEAVAGLSKSLKPNVVIQMISNAKAHLIGPEEYRKQAFDFVRKQVADLYAEYERILQENHALDFDDLLIYGVRLLKECEEVRNHYQSRFRHVMIDEYQDTNHPQYLIAHILAEKYGNLCVVGDDDQSIYRWRGAQLSNILEFGRDHKQVKVIPLEQNYRSTKTILEAANSVVARNRDRRSKRLWTESEKGEPIGIAILPDEAMEAKWIAQQVQELHQTEQCRWSEIAIFYRINAQSRSFEDAFRREKIPYVVVGGLSFYERKEIKDVLAYLRLLINPRDTASFARIANEPRRRLGAQSVETLVQFAEMERISVLRACLRAEEVVELSPMAKRSAKQFANMYQRWGQNIKELSIEEFIKVVLRDSGYEEMLTSSQDIQDRTRWENIGELISAAAEFEKECLIRFGETLTVKDVLAGYLEEVSLVSDVDEWKNREDSLVMMTLHSAKGLEFPVVFLTGMEEGLLPHARSQDSKEELEEERRLCYVGITRAKKRLFITRAYTRRLFGTPQQNFPSRFLKEIPPSCVRNLPSTVFRDDSLWDRFEDEEDKPEKPEKKGSPKVQERQEFAPGDMVNHRTFGLGVVLEVTGTGAKSQITVEFQNGGKKKLVQGYAKLERVGMDN